MVVRSSQKRLSRSRTLFLVGVFVVGGVGIFWGGLRSFRARAEESERSAQIKNETSQEASSVHASLLESLPNNAVLRGSSGEMGRAMRTFTDTGATLDVLLTAPPLDASFAEYHVWLIKDGFADVVDLGALTLRADGAWGGVFLVGPMTGVVDARLFSRIVVMVEPRDGNTAPSGVKICEGVWE